MTGTVLLLLLAGLPAPSPARVPVTLPELPANVSRPGHDSAGAVSNNDPVGPCPGDVHGRPSAFRASSRTDADTLETPPSPDGNIGHARVEPGETVIPQAAWINDDGDDLTLSRTTPHLRGPPGVDSDPFTVSVPTFAGGFAASLLFSCPTNSRNRCRMAVFIVEASGLVLYGAQQPNRRDL